MRRGVLCAAALAFALACATPWTPETEPASTTARDGAKRLESQTVGPIVSRAEAAMEREDFTAAIAFYSAAYERTPWNTRLRDSLVAAHAARARQLRELARFRELAGAEQHLRDALELMPEDPDLEGNLAVVLVERSSVELDPVRAAKFRAEARALDPEASARVPVRRADLERRLDLAFELIERGQLDAGIQRLQALVRSEPGFEPALRLLAQAEFRKGARLHRAGRYAEAAAALDAAVQAYGRIEPCAGVACPDAQLRSELRGEERDAHRSRVVAWLDAGRPGRAREALGEAEQAGFRFPRLRSALP